MRTAIQRILWIGMILLVAGCVAAQQAETHIQQPQEPQSTRVPASAQSKKMAEASNAFGFDLFRQLLQDMDSPSQPASPLQIPADDVCKQPPVQNIFISPLSLSLVLQLAGNGATGVTAEEIAEVLSLTGLSLDESNQASLDLYASLRSEPSVDLLIANPAWIREGSALVPDYVQAAQTYFDAEVRTFQGPADVAQINGWVAEKTEEMITEIIEEISPEELLFLINAIYFKGDWAEAFRRDYTRDGAFHVSDIALSLRCR